MTYKPEKGSRQPVVLYDKDNTAIDVSGIEELSSIKIDTGEIAGDLKLVKDNQGRLYGKYGEAWIPVKVDSEGRPIISQGPAGTEPWPVQLTDSEDLAQDVTVQGVKSELESVKSELVLVKSELATIKENQLSGDQKVTLSGTKVVESAPVTGIKTVTSTVAEVFAGSSRKANRSKLIVRNLHPAVAIRIGGSGITDTIGQSLEPGASVEIDFSPSTTVSIYAVSTAGNVSVEVLEV